MGFGDLISTNWMRPSNLVLNKVPTTQRLLFPLGIAVCLSLFGDLTLYAVLATERAATGLSLSAVGVMLAANRLIRIPGNPIVGTLFDAGGRRRLFILGMTLGTLSTAIYGLVRGFVPFLLARLLWGTAWMLINIGGTTMVLDISSTENRGKLVGSYNTWVLLGFALGPFVGGLLVTRLGFHTAMLVCAGCTAIGLLFAAFCLPETAPGPGRAVLPSLPSIFALWREGARLFSSHPRLTSAALLYALSLFVGEGLALSTLNLWLEYQLGITVTISTMVFGVAAVSGFLAGLRALAAGLTGPVAGKLSDFSLGRDTVIAVGMLISALGLVWLTLTTSLWSIVLAVLVSAVGDGAVRSVLTAVLGDNAPLDQKGLAMGMYATIGDVGSTFGPIVAFVLLPVIGLRWLYVLCAIIFIVGVGWVWLAQRYRDAQAVKFPEG